MLGVHTKYDIIIFFTFSFCYEDILTWNAPKEEYKFRAKRVMCVLHLSRGCSCLSVPRKGT